MSDPYIGEIKMLPFSWAPVNWALCNGQLLQVQQNAALFSVLGIAFGGDGSTTFGLPDLRGRTPVGMNKDSGANDGYTRGNIAGAETVTLTAAQVPGHTHSVVAYAQNGTQLAPAGNVISNVVTAKNPPTTTDFSSYRGAADWTADAQLNAASVTTSGGNAPHNNMQPFTVLNFCICQIGLYPSRN